MKRSNVVNNREYLFILLGIFLISCSTPELLPPGETFEFDNPKFSNMSEACNWVYENIEYKKDKHDDWQLPQETLDRGKGDCEDMAILLMGIMKYQKGYNSELVIVKFDSNSNHAIVKHKDKYYDCTNKEVSKHCKYEIINSYDLYQTMYIAYYKNN